MKTIYVGNLSYSSTEQEVQELFAQYGTIHRVKIIRDYDTNRSRGYGFVDMDDTEADAAMQAYQLNIMG